jgi:hypothetical protein
MCDHAAMRWSTMVHLENVGSQFLSLRQIDYNFIAISID